MYWVLLGLLGLTVGILGTIVGAAGGFLLIPILLFVYPGESPAIITSITLTVAFFNALSGSIAYGRLGRIDYRSAILFSLVGVPGAVIGATLTHFLSRGAFQYIFATILLITAVYLMVKPERLPPHAFGIIGLSSRKITDSQNNVYTYSFSKPLGMVIAFVVGLIGGTLGIGGGIMHVPMLTQLLGFPVHVATATSHFIVAITTFGALVTHIVSGVFTTGVYRALVLSLGAVIGAQFGARLSQRVSGALIVRVLAIGLLLVAIRLLAAPF